MKIYLDVCCLNRPFDDQAQDRIRLESEAVLIILNRFEKREWEWISSNVVDLEIDRSPDQERRTRVKLLARFAYHKDYYQENDFTRVKQLEEMGIKGYDAFHIACAERSGCDIFLTTDDRLLANADRNAENIHLQVLNPLDWINKAIEE